MGLARYYRAKVDASWHDCAEILAIVERIVALDLAGRAAIGCVGADRADLIVPGCAIFSALVELWPCSRLGSMNEYVGSSPASASRKN